MPHILLSADDGWVTYVPAGTGGTYASSIGVPGRDQLPRAERTMDLVVDLMIRPDGGWEWKDRDDFDEAVRRGLLDRPLLETFEAEAERILGEAAAGAGPFGTVWRAWRPDPAWERPKLPARFQAGGSAWSRTR